MSELRQNLISRDWVIIATERAKRPDQFVGHQKGKKQLPEYQDDCPFCPGRENSNPQETFRISRGARWQVRVIPNKFPALSSEGSRHRKTENVYRSMPGFGVHEVIVEHPRHNLSIALLSVEDVADILKSYRQRYQEIRKDPRIETIILFKNHGESAGTSLEHPHSQLVATPIVPIQIRERVNEAIRYFDDTGECVFCRTLHTELFVKERIVFETPHFVAFFPYASLSPFHFWIFPRRHMSSFDKISDAEIQDLALNLRTVLAKLYYGLNDADYNYVIRSIPTAEQETAYFHWYISIVPKVTRTAGFEIGSGMFVNTALPEQSAKFLREIKIPQ